MGAEPAEIFFDVKGGNPILFFKEGGFNNRNKLLKLPPYKSNSFEVKDMIRINFTLYEFPRENIQTGISNMEDIHEMMS